MKQSASPSIKLASKGLLLLAMGGIVVHLPGCGGGNSPGSVGVPLNPTPGPAAPAPLAVNPPSVTLYSGQPSTLLVSGGVPPYRAFSSNPAILPVLQDVIGSVIPVTVGNVVTAAVGATSVTVTITDFVGNSTAATIGAVASPFLDRATALTVTGANCAGGAGANTVCAGQTAVARLLLQGATGAPLAGRQVRFEALQGQFNFVLDDASSQLAKSAVVTTDSQGQAIIRIRADNNAITSFALLRATDLTTGARLDNSFPIQQVTEGATVLTVTPNNWKVTGPYKGFCAQNAEVGYYIFGGSPPYRVVSSIPTGILVGNTFGGPYASTTTVNNNGGYFVGRTTGQCVNNSTSTILITDSTGRTIGAGLENAEGSEALPTAPPAPAPASFNASPNLFNLPVVGSSCSGSVQVGVSGGTPPYRFVNVDPAKLTVSFPNPNSSPTGMTLSTPTNRNLLTGESVIVVITDSLQSTTAQTITLKCGT